MNLIKNQKGMNIVGQGGKILLTMLPFLVFAIWLHLSKPELVSLSGSLTVLRVLGLIVLVLGILFWATAVIQLLIGFPKGKLITNGAYGVARNPIYSSVTFFVLPGLALFTLKWIYFLPAIVLYFGVLVFIKEEEKQLTKAFGKEYEDYQKRVNRVIPFIKI